MVKARSADVCSRPRQAGLGSAAVGVASGANIADTGEAPGNDLDVPQWPRVVEGCLVYRGELKVGEHTVPASEQATFAAPVLVDPQKAAEDFAGNYDGLFPETTKHDLSSVVKLKGFMKTPLGGREKVKARFSATGHVTVESIPEPEDTLLGRPGGQDLFARECEA